MGTPNREPQELSRIMIEYKGSSKYLLITFPLCSWGSLFEVSIEVPLFFRVFSLQVFSRKIGIA